jgi:hypothetical protein
MNCPISFEPKIDSHILRINSFFYIAFTFAAYITNNAFFILPLVAIFISKNINIQQKCMMDITSEFIKNKILKIKQEKMIDPAPKKIANMLGLFGSIMLFTTNYLELSIMPIPYILMTLAFSLELVFDYCMGCKIYHMYNKVIS